MPRSVVSSLSSRQAPPKRCDILPEALIGGPIRPRQREQNRHQNVGEHRRDGDVAGPRRIMLRLEELGGVSAAIVKLRGEIVRLGGVASANGADQRIVPIGRFQRRYPINAFTSMRVGVSGATPIAIANATMPSILPTIVS